MEQNSAMPTHDALTEELLRMPKLPIVEVETAFVRQTRWFVLLTIACIIIAAACYLVSVVAINEEPWFTMALVIGMSSALLVVFSTVMLMRSLTERSHLKSLASGNYYACWPISPDEWARKTSAGRSSWAKAVRWGTAAAGVIFFILAIAGDVFDFIVGGETGLGVFPKILPPGLNVIGYTLLGTIAAFGTFRLIEFFLTMRHRIEDSCQPQVIVGPNAIYVTGRLHRLTTISTHVIRVARNQGNENELVFVLETSGDPPLETFIQATIPNEETASADALVSLLQTRFNLKK